MRTMKITFRFHRHFNIALIFAGLFLFIGIMPDPVPFWLPATALASDKTNAVTAPASIPDLVEKLSPTVVNISTSRVVKDRLGREVTQKGMGTGFIISEDGYIFTNHHVVNKAGKIKVKTAV